MATEARFAAIVLAAGSASRFGGGKLLADWNGAPLLHAALAAARAAPVQDIVVVTGADPEAIGGIVRTFDRAIRVTHAPDHAEGMAASLRAGIAALGTDITAVFVFLGDMPRVPLAVLSSLAEAVRQGAPAAAPVFQGRRGNPVVLSRDLFDQVAQLRGDVGARGVLDSLGQALACVTSPDDGVLFDVDTRADLQTDGEG